MRFDHKVCKSIATALAKHFDSLYYVDIETSAYKEFVSSELFHKQKIPKQGSDFFELSRSNAEKYVHPDDLEHILNIHTKEYVIRKLSENNVFSTTCSLLIEGIVFHIRHVFILCDDKKHILCGMENIEKEFAEREERSRILENAELKARRDELTGIKNKNAFSEYVDSLNNKIDAENGGFDFGVVMCDVNDLKLTNDTRGHSLGDELIQKTSRMICNIFKHSPVFRIGGDEFAVILTGEDFKQSDQLLTILRTESNTNAKFRSGPVVACGMSLFNHKKDDSFSSVFKRADKEMYENKKSLKSKKISGISSETERLDITISDERKRKLDSLFDALYTVSGGGYVYLNDMRYDYSRWSLPLIDDFGLTSEYMYNAAEVWEKCIHPEDIKIYRDAVDAVFNGNSEVKHIHYRAKKTDGTYVSLTTRGFILCDGDGAPVYFGGIIIRH